MRTAKSWIGLITLAVVFPFAWADATPLTVANHSFETPLVSSGTFIASDSSAPTGWSIYGSLQSGFRFFGALNPTGTTLYSGGAPDGSNVGVVFLFTPESVEGGLQQTLGDTLQLSTQYTLTVDVGNIANDSTPPHNSFNFTGFPGYRVELLAGGTVIASDNNTLAPSEGSFLTSEVTFTTGTSHALAGQALGLRLINLNGSGIEVNFDNVRLDASAVPEPSSLGLILVGLFVAYRTASPRRSLRRGFCPRN
ncbi:MAG: hypothetical protein ACOYMS_09750 [Terrimicrobiaceae bacterium]